MITPIAINTRILNYRITGAQRYVREMIKRLPQDRITAIAPRSWHAGIRGHFWEQCVLPFRIAGGSLLWSPSITGPLAVRNQVVTIFDVVPLDHPEWFQSKFSRFIHLLVPPLARRAKHIIAISEFTKQRIVELCGVAPEKITVTLLAADARFNPAAADPARISALKLPTQRYLLTLGSIEPRKNIPLLLRAWRRIEAQVPADVCLVVAGGSGNKAIFGDVQLGEVSSRVHFTGHVPDESLPALLAGAMAFCYPSVYEGFGLPPLEAMASGVPVLTGNLTSLPEVVGDAGLMVDPTSEEALADGLLRLATDAELRATLRQRGLERNRLFDWNTTATQTWDILSKAAAC